MTTPVSPSPDKLQKILDTVRKLIAKSESTDSLAEADALRQRADKMMLDYAISEAELDASRPAAQRVKPETLRFMMCAATHPMAKYLSQLAANLAEHCRCRIVFYNLLGKYGDASILAIGFPGDLRYLELLYTTLHLHMSGEIEPKPDTAKSFDENVYDLHEAGVKWQRIAEIMNKAYRPHIHRHTSDGGDIPNPDAVHWRKSVRAGKGSSDLVLVPWPDGARLKTAYRRHCALIGDTPRAIVSPINFQRNFASAYVARISTRLWEMRQKNDGIGTALVLRQEDVNKMYTEMFPDLKATKNKVKERFDWEAQDAGRKAANKADLGGAKVSGDAKPEIKKETTRTPRVGSGPPPP